MHHSFQYIGQIPRLAEYGDKVLPCRPISVKKWSLRTLREKLIRFGAKVVRHSRYVVFQMAELAVPRTPFREVLKRIGQLRASPELAGSS